MILKDFRDAGLISPPDYVLDNLCLLSYGGSISYGVNTPDSDIDLIGFYIPPKEYVYQPGIYGFDKENIPNVFTKQHVIYNGKSYDIVIYTLPNLYKLAFDGNPNILDFLMAERKYVIFSNAVGDGVLDNAQKFISKKCFERFLGFCKSELHVIENGINKYKSKDPVLLAGARKYLYDKYGYDVKAAGNMCRLASSLDDILDTGIYCPSSCAENVKRVRSGEFTFNMVKDGVLGWINNFESKKIDSKIQATPDYHIIKNNLSYFLNLFYKGL